MLQHAVLNLNLDPDACKTPVNMDPGGDIHLVHMDSE